MSNSTIATITAMSTPNFISLCLTILGALSIVALILNSLGFIQIGDVTLKRTQEGQSTMHNMDEENADADDLLKSKLRQMTNSLRKRIYGLFNMYPACTMTRRALSSSLRFPLYESIGNNHYTKELMPDKFYDYRRRMLTALEDEYTDILTSVSDVHDCNVPNDLPAWKDASTIIERFLDMWLLDVLGMVSDCSRQKIETYQKYLLVYKSCKDKYRATITEACIEKNRAYIRELEVRATSIKNDLGQKKI
jgi:hypothetical protein